MEVVILGIILQYILLLLAVSYRVYRVKADSVKSDKVESKAGEPVEYSTGSKHSFVVSEQAASPWG